MVGRGHAVANLDEIYKEMSELLKKLIDGVMKMKILGMAHTIAALLWYYCLVHTGYTFSARCPKQ